jgi:hypothetical protein
MPLFTYGVLFIPATPAAISFSPFTINKKFEALTTIFKVLWKWGNMFVFREHLLSARYEDHSRKH